MIAHGAHRLLCGALLLFLFYPYPMADAYASYPQAGILAPEPQHLTARGEVELREYLKTGLLAYLRRPDFRNHRKEAKEFYESLGDGLAWVRRNKPTRQALSVIRLLETADRKGLDPEDYDGPRWNQHLAELEQRSESTQESLLVRFDLALTVCTMRYVSDLYAGRANPRIVQFRIKLDHRSYNLPEFVKQRLITAANVETMMEGVEPPYPGYRRTVAALARYRQLATVDDGKQLPVTKRAVSAGDSYAGLPRLIRLLHLLGDLPGGVELPPSDTVYQGALVEAVKSFQSRHGLEPDGKIGARTFKELNTPLARRVVQLQLALERWRWLPRMLEPPLIIVNIPEFQLYAESGPLREILSMKVVVGKAYRNETPVFSSAVKSVVFRPDWIVPVGITREELVPKIEKSPGYLAKNRYEMIDSQGGVVQANTPDVNALAGLRTGRLMLRQLPGPRNALGLVKFDMPNGYQIYMHGTPETELFRRSRRDFSHGCIRVEDPVALAAWLLRDQPEWTLPRIRTVMSGDETLRVSLTEPVPVLVLYATAMVRRDGEIHFADDIYGYDKALETALGSVYGETD